ncbi:hypothetical protein MAR_001689 [Mya arenaria]|uniref:Uncharacterized protein n=1 Tax=Mya arenaria TaxID=6604 RepID=A0ABY7FGI2_MYAAR|nr:hypothetical protein MAR_001689 [Mya arenaria]
MEKSHKQWTQKKGYCALYLFLLTMTANVKLNNAAPVVVVPIAVYAGAAVSPWVWAALVAVYGAATLAHPTITRAVVTEDIAAGRAVQTSTSTNTIALYAETTSVVLLDSFVHIPVCLLSCELYI